LRAPTARERGSAQIEIDELVGLAAKLVGDHRRRSRQRGDDADPFALVLKRLDKRAEIAVSENSTI
jgi:hypothetical protein